MKRRMVMLLTATLIVASMGMGCGKTDKVEVPATEGGTAQVTETASEEMTKATEETAETTEQTGYEDIITDVAYADDGKEYHVLDLYGTQSVQEATPTVIEVHGGGYIGGTKDINKEHSIFFAESGYTVVTPEYGKLPTDGTFVDTVQDLFGAYNWVAEHAEEYHLDLNNIFLSGDSAGGYYVLLTNAIWNSQSLQEYFGVTVPEYDFSAYLTTCPGTDIRKLQEDIKLESGPNAHVAQTIGEDIVMDEDLMSHLDLYSNVEPQVFENLYMLTTPGDTTTGGEVQKFDQYLTDNGVAHTLKVYENQENELIHVFNIDHGEYAESIQANQDMVDHMNSLLK